MRLSAWNCDAIGSPQLRYRRLTPNYEKYWMSDTDAVNSLDRDETARWFLSRGDECLNCDGGLHAWEHKTDPLILRIHKKPGRQPAQQAR